MPQIKNPDVTEEERAAAEGEGRREIAWPEEVQLCLYECPNGCICVGDLDQWQRGCTVCAYSGKRMTRIARRNYLPAGPPEILED